MDASRDTVIGSAETTFGGPVHGPNTGRRFQSMRWRMLLPVVVAAAGALVLGVLRILDASGAAADAARARALAQAEGQLVTAAHVVSGELAVIDQVLRTGSDWRTVSASFEETDRAREAANDSLAAIRNSTPDLDELCQVAEGSLQTLDFARVLAETSVDGSATLQAYYDGATLALLAVADAIPAHLNDTRLVELAQAGSLIGHLDRLAVLQLDLIDRSIYRESINAVDTAALPAWLGEERTREATLRNLAQVRPLYEEYLESSEISGAAAIRQEIVNNSADAQLSTNGAAWRSGQQARIEALAQLRPQVTARLVSEAERLERVARTTALIVGGFSALLVVVTLGTATALAARTIRRLRRTRAAVVSAARVELPSAISHVVAARDEHAVRVALAESSRRVEAMLATGNDEIGELASAFGGVHRQAMRLAAEQALLRMEVQAIFLALSRRGLALVNRQMHLMDQFGRTEVDPESLDRLFALDHLAARMRRNEENLLVLGGGEPFRRISQPVALADLLRAAAQEIDDYRRVEISYAQDLHVGAQVAGDVIHLLAELLENATAFSPPSSTVRVDAQRGRDGLIITVIDRGIGMAPDQLAEANERLRQTNVLTSSLVGTMGLLVVARLAQRHGLMVQLVSQPAAGTVANVFLPDAYISMPTAHGSLGSRTAVLSASPVTGEFARPRPAAGTAGRARVRPAPPDPEAVRQRLSSFDRGRAAAGRTVPMPGTSSNNHEERR